MSSYLTRNSVPGGWLMPIAIFFIISFPPVRYHSTRHFPITLILSLSSLVMKSSLLSVVSFGASGPVLVSPSLVPSSVKSVTSSAYSLAVLYPFSSLHSVFRYFLQSRAEEQEKKSIFYACLAKVVRQGGFKVAVIVRYSAVPGHCESLSVRKFWHSLILQSHNCHICRLWHEHIRLYHCCTLVHA